MAKDTKKLIQIMVTVEEKKRIEKQMERENFRTVSDFIRKSVLDRCVDEVK